MTRQNDLLMLGMILLGITIIFSAPALIIMFAPLPPIS